MIVSFIHLYHDWKSCREKALLINFKNLNAQIAHLLVTQLQVETFFKTKCFIVSGTHVHSKGKDESTKEDWINLLSVTRMSQVMVFHKYVDILRKLPGKKWTNIIKNIDAVYMEFICTFYADCLSIYLMLLFKKILWDCIDLFLLQSSGSQSDWEVSTKPGGTPTHISMNFLPNQFKPLMHFWCTFDALSKSSWTFAKSSWTFWKCIKNASAVHQKCIKSAS